RRRRWRRSCASSRGGTVRSPRRGTWKCRILNAIWTMSPGRPARSGPACRSAPHWASAGAMARSSWSRREPGGRHSRPVGQGRRPLLGPGGRGRRRPRGRPRRGGRRGAGRPALRGERFRRATRECLWALAAVEAMLEDGRAERGAIAGDRTALIFVSAAGYGASNRAFIEGTGGGTHFAYTAPAVVPAEAAIEYRLRGPSVLLIGGPRGG